MAHNTFLPPSPVIPGMLLVTNITTSNPMVVTVTNSIYNTYIVGMLVCLTVPPQYGMRQANELIGQITNISGTNFTLDINSLGFDQFVIPAPSIPPPSRPASLAPAGNRNNYNVALEPFQSLNGQQGN